MALNDRSTLVTDDEVVEIKQWLARYGDTPWKELALATAANHDYPPTSVIGRLVNLMAQYEKFRIAVEEVLFLEANDSVGAIQARIDVTAMIRTYKEGS